MDFTENSLSDEQRDVQFCHAFEQLNTLVDWSQFDLEFPRRGNAVFSNSLVMLMLLYQRMQPDKSLELTVKKVLEFAPKLLPAEHKRVREGTLSSNPAGYSRARTKCPLEAVKKLANMVSQTLIDQTRASLNGRRVTVIDGTTITLAPDSGLRHIYPSA